MKNLVFCFLLLNFTWTTFAQKTITGDWHGLVSLGAQQLALILHVQQDGEKFLGTLDSPDQKAFGINIDKLSFEKGVFHFEVTKIGVSYTGDLNDSVINGIFSQGYFKTPMELKRQVIAKKIILRSQEPKAPFNYVQEDINFQHQSTNFNLSGSVTKPLVGTNFPAVILISGSGPQDRNEEIQGHKPFLIIADYLSKKGFLVLRYDDRGTGKSGGQFEGATSIDLASDASSAIAYLKTRKDVDSQKIILIGHSEGGMLATMLAAEDKSIHAIVLLAGLGISGYQVLLKQQALIAKVNGVSDTEIEEARKINAALFDVIIKAKDLESAKRPVEKFLTKTSKKLSKETLKEYENEDAFVKAYMDAFLAPWMFTFLRYDPKNDFSKISCHVLAMNGSKDLQVSPQENLLAMNQFINNTGKKKEVLELPNLNHLFQHCETGNITEYGEIDETFAVDALEKIVRFLAATLP